MNQPAPPKSEPAVAFAPGDRIRTETVTGTYWTVVAVTDHNLVCWHSDATPTAEKLLSKSHAWEPVPPPVKRRRTITDWEERPPKRGERFEHSTGSKRILVAPEDFTTPRWVVVAEYEDNPEEVGER